jgi:hypothetical protein
VKANVAKFKDRNASKSRFMTGPQFLTCGVDNEKIPA